MGSPVLPRFSLCTCRRHYPGGTAGCLSLSSPAMPAFPVETQVSSHIARFEACSTFTRVTARTLAESLNDPFHRRLQTGRCLPACSDCYRLERPLPGGTCTLSRTVPFHGTRFLRALPGDRACLPPSSADRFCLSPVGPTQLRELDASVGASGPHDFAVRSNISRRRAVDRSRIQRTRPAIPSRAKRCRVHRTPPRVRDDHDTPLWWGGMARVLDVIWGRWQQIFFGKNQKKTRQPCRQTARRANHHTTAKANSARVPDPCSVLPALPTGRANARPMAGSASSGHAAPQSRDLYRHEPGGPRISRSRHAGIPRKNDRHFRQGKAEDIY